MKIDIHKLVGFTPKQEEQFRNILSVGTNALNSEHFKSSVLNFTWVEYYRKWFRKYSILHNTFNWNNGLSNQEIYDLFMSGVDQLNTDADGDLDLFLELYFANNSVIGYTYPTIVTTYANKKYFLGNLESKSGNAAIFANIIHEYLHKVGFDHSYYNNATRRYTVPYAMGDIAEESYRYFLNS